jgi:predicted flap endonuclease-1-like 5' DNA nuclease
MEGDFIMTKLSDIEGIGKLFTEKLKAAGITSEEDLLAAGSTKEGRADLAEKSDISEKLILKWANRADLARIKGIGGEYADLLEEAGVDTLPELARCKADHLLTKMAEINATRQLVRKMPVLKQVEDWIKHAALLPRVLKY